MHKSKILARLALVGGMVLVPTLPPAFGQGGFEGVGTYEIVNRNSNKVVDLDRNDGSTVIQFESKGTDNQRWEIRGAQGNMFYIINAMNGKALEAMGDADHDPVRGMPFRQTESQQWRIENTSQSAASIINSNGAALDVSEGSRSNGAKLQIFSPNESGAQQFLLRRVGSSGGWRPGSPPPSSSVQPTGTRTYQLVNRNSNKAVNLDRNNGTSIIQYDSSDATNQQWDVEDAGGGYSYLVNRLNGHALEALGSKEHSPVRGAPLRRTESQQWRFENGPNGSVVIVNRNGAVLDVSEGSRHNGVSLQMFSRNNSPAQLFELRTVGGSGGSERRRAR